LGKHELDEMLGERERLNLDVQQILDAQTDSWGIKVTNVEIKHIDLNESMIRAIARQAEAERERRAKIIHAEGEKQAAQTLREAAEMLADIQAYDEAKVRIAAGEEIIPAEVTYALIEGANPIAVWRKHRKLTQAALAAQAGISKAYLSQLESGKRSGAAGVLARLALALRVDLDDLVNTAA